MCPERGFGVIAAIFILVILGVLTAGIVAVSTSQHAGSALDVQVSRATVAARAGLDWAAHRAVVGGGCAAVAAESGAFPALDGMTVSATCSQTTAAPTVTLYKIVVTACNMPAGSACPGSSASPGYVERRIRAYIRN
jgi:MSHA biogenesis protein MshP